MKSICFENDGVLDILSLVLMGASTKRGDHTKIGEYGSGWKYAIAILLRHGISFSIETDDRQIQIWVREVKLRDVPFSMVMIDGRDANFTTDLGKDWELWMALREIYCNTLDEPNSLMRILEYGIEDASLTVPYDKTRILVDVTPEIEAIVNNWDEYFSTRRTDQVLAMPGLRVYKKLHGHKSIIYRKGIKVAESKKEGCFDYDFEDLPINEMRQLRFFSEVEDRLKIFMKNTITVDVLGVILNSKDTWEKELRFYSWESLNAPTKKVWADTVGKRAIVPAEYVDKLTGKDTNPDTVLLMPACLAQLISIEIPELLVLGYGNGSDIVIPVKAGAAEMNKLYDAINHLAESMGAGIRNYLYEPVELKNDWTYTTHGDATICISEKFLCKATTGEIAYQLFREITLLESGFKLYSSELQDHLFKQLYGRL